MRTWRAGPWWNNKTKQMLWLPSYSKCLLIKIRSFWPRDFTIEDDCRWIPSSIATVYILTHWTMWYIIIQYFIAVSMAARRFADTGNVKNAVCSLTRPFTYAEVDMNMNPCTHTDMWRCRHTSVFESCWEINASVTFELVLRVSWKCFSPWAQLAVNLEHRKCPPTPVLTVLYIFGSRLALTTI